MTFFRSADIDLMLAQFGVSVTVGATTVKGLVDIVDESLLSDASVSFDGQSVQVTVKTGALPTLAVGSALVADGVSYRVMRVRQIDDGALTVINVART
jgi:hypothetical protein